MASVSGRSRFDFAFGGLSIQCPFFSPGDLLHWSDRRTRIIRLQVDVFGLQPRALSFAEAQRKHDREERTQPAGGLLRLAHNMIADSTPSHCGVDILAGWPRPHGHDTVKRSGPS